MEFQEAVVRLIVKKPTDHHRRRHAHQKKWNLSLHRPSTPSSSVYSSSSLLSPSPSSQSNVVASSEKGIPEEFLCPISGSLMNDPVIVSSGHSFDRVCVNACNTLRFFPALLDGSAPDFSTVINNKALKSTILNWCKKNSVNPPKPLDFFSAEKLVRKKMEEQQRQNSGYQTSENKDLIVNFQEEPSPTLKHAVTELARRSTHFHSSSDESCGNAESSPSLNLTTRPSCVSSPASSSSEIIDDDPNSEEEEIVTKLTSPLVFDIEEALSSLRKLTRTREDMRVQLCTARLLSSLLPLITSRYNNVQVNSVACLVNLSLEKVNKVIIVRSGMIPPLIDVLKGGYPEAQEHACGAIFSLALDDHNKLAIGALGALPPLIHMLRAESDRARQDSASALYHLSLGQTNRTKMVKLGAVPVLLGMVKSGHLRNRVLLILSNLAFCEEGRDTMLDVGGVECIVRFLKESESNRESCTSVLYGLSHGGLRFRGLAKAAGAVEVLVEMEKELNARSREKARRILEVLRTKMEEDDEGVNWEDVLELDSRSRTRSQLGNSSGF